MEVNDISKETKVSMKTRIITGIVMALVILPCAIIGNWLFIALVSFIVGVGLNEVIKSTGKKYPWPVLVLLYVFTYSFVFWVFFQKGNNVQSSSAYYDAVNNHFYMFDIRISTMGVGFLIGILFLMSIVSHNTDLSDVFYLFTMSLFLGFAGQSLLFLRFCPEAISYGNFTYPNEYVSSILLIFIAGGTMLNDIWAYFVGVLFGKHKMAPIISPKKTWEGFFGGIILSSIIVTTLALISDLVFDIPILKGILDAEHWFYVIIISICIGLSSVLGDLMFSSIKRSFNIKDFGTIFPGHGGVLDRFDSILMTSMLSAIVITFVYYNPVFGALL